VVLSPIFVPETGSILALTKIIFMQHKIISHVMKVREKSRGSGQRGAASPMNEKNHWGLNPS